MSESSVSRREFVRAMAVGTGAVALPGCAARIAASAAATEVASGWDRVPGILARVSPPVFPGRDFDITTYGARGDGVADCTEAFRRAVAACRSAGGGAVVVPSGRFLTGPIHLATNVNLHVSDGATIAF